ncbi:Maf family protein [Nitrosomonas ureae]|uniref:7-methyl-GTP pyrophosphatase n=1 Tax=Nitrosomonas ureae TaxID=44577 RepID=A0A0S3AGA5_9PROT|nr:Maf family nucleotide pyrophosphatase [Nitrosomonas ureae]ALQ50213.1 septum formation inhibitor Maf [Nitrosomonas ureae]SDT85211.1 septum formation protein [Nitrosomonas ureae]SEQ00888.1 septum formation protein [Nitrosomonas ureae]
MKTKNDSTPQIILGSSSIYRKELLQRLQICFETSNPQIDETPLINESPRQTAARLAEAKARAVATIYPQALIIGSDQVAALGDIRLGKPLNHANAVEQLRQTQGKEVVFYTAVCVLNSFTDKLHIRVIPYHVQFRRLSDQQIENYLLKEQPYQCAGSAKSEGLGIALIERMTGDDPSGLIGLPLITLIDMLTIEGVKII